jgi:primosomal protein N' (replication factor Y) (superfamily II helicase)
MRSVVDVLPQLRTAQFDRALTYLVPAGLRLGIGDVVRVPLGTRQVNGYVLTDPHERGDPGGLREVVGRIDGDPAFGAEALSLARWMADRYCCSLGEAISAVVFGGAIPRAVDRFTVVTEPARDLRFPSVPRRLLRLIFEDLRDGFSLEQVLRHPDARRAGDRRSLLGHLGALVRGGALKRTRTFGAPRMRESLEKVLAATGQDVRGPRVRALVALVQESGQLRRADALLAGFSASVIARAVREGALRETERRPAQAVSGSGVGLELVPTAEQRVAIDALSAALVRGTFEEFLIQGVTGSGKTFVYIAAIERALAAGGAAIVLVPEIALTPQTARRFERSFGDRVAVLHSALSERERFENWREAARGNKRVIVGARSALFAPLPNVRLIVVDEAHERTYKQESTPRYDAIAVARERMRDAGGVLVLGSATPPLEEYAATLRGGARRIVLTERATAMPLPDVRVIDMAEEFERGNRRIFSSLLVDAIGKRLECGEKVVLFVNRRGSASFMLCRACGFVPECDRCSISLTLHRADGLLRCHLCDAQRRIPERCPKCGGGAIREFGVGTQKVAETAQALFPAARVIRMDSDTTTRIGDHARLLDEFAERGDILVGTQMVAKGLDFPTVTLVGVVAADVGLHVPDFRAAERTFDLLTQVAGRSGRTSAGEAIVQTYSPRHPAVMYAARHDFEGFANQELAERRTLRYPPFGELAYLGVIGRRARDVSAAATRYAGLVRGEDVGEVLGPAPYPIPRVNDEWRFRIAVKTPDSAPLRAFIREKLAPLARTDKTTRLVVNIDP